MTKVKVQITLPAELRSIIKQNAQEDFTSFSGWIERAALYYLKMQKNQDSKLNTVRKIDLGI